MVRPPTVLSALALTLSIVSCAPEPEPTCAELGDCEVGVECATQSDCASGVCDGMCRLRCSDEDECGVGEGCRFVDAGDAAATACVPVEPTLGDLGDPCVADSECRGGICRNGACSELCLQCTHGALCVPETRQGLAVGVCEWDPVGPSVTLGPFAASADGTEQVSFDVPLGVESFVVIVRDGAPGGERRVGIAAVIAPDGTVLDNGDLDRTDPNPAAIRYPDATTLMVPIRDDGLVEPGTYVVAGRIWDIDFTATDPFVPTTGELYFDVVFEWAGEQGGLLDLNLFVAPGTGLTPNDTDYIDRMLNVVSDQFAGAGAGLGRTTVTALGADRDTVASEEAARDMARSLSQPGRYGAAVNVFVVDRFESSALGFTGAAPSPPGVFGIAAAGIAVDASPDPDQTGIVLAHEIGHFLGLSHTTSLDVDGQPAGTDPISDTPECTDSADCPDRANLMFPRIDFGETHTLSPGQMRVVSGNPVLYEFVRPDLCEPWPATDVTVTRAAAGRLTGTGTTAGSCGGTGPERAHVLRVAEGATVMFSSPGATVYVRSADCELGEELGCAADSLTLDLDRGEYFVFVDSDTAETSYQLRVETP